MRRITERLTYANVMATVAVFIAIGGSATAAVLITGKNIKNGSIKSVDLAKSSVTSSTVKDGSLLSNDFKAGQLPGGLQGPKGDTGATGATGPAGKDGAAGAPGASATKLWAVVGSAGVLVRSSGVTTATKLGPGPGDYTVTFNQAIVDCAWLATVGTFNDATSPPGEISTEQHIATDPATLEIRTRDSGGAAADRGFHLAVFC